MNTVRNVQRRAAHFPALWQRVGRAGLAGLASLCVAIGCGASVVGAAEGGAYVLADAQCSPEVQGVLDLTLVNDTGADVRFVLTVAGAQSPSTIVVGPSSAYAVTYTGLADGQVVVPITLDGADVTAVAHVACAAPRVESLGVAPQSASVEGDLPGQLPATGSSSGGLLIGSVMVAAGMAASLISRRRAS